MKFCEMQPYVPAFEVSCLGSRKLELKQKQKRYHIETIAKRKTLRNGGFHGLAWPVSAVSGSTVIEELPQRYHSELKFQ